ncbi:MAG: IPT/TIG domain-containing protein [Patescibacteria group bacterium]
MIEKLSLIVLLLQQLAAQLAQPTVVPATPLVVQSSPPVMEARLTARPAQLPSLRPVIDKVEPTKGRVGTRVTITGAGFDRERNVVYTGAGEVVVPSRDGKTLSFTPPRPPFLSEKWLSATADYRQKHHRDSPIRFPLGFYVKNKNGVTVKPGLFSLTI